MTVKDCANGTEWTAFNGVESHLPSLTSYSLNHLTPGREYKFSVTAYNYNGAGDTSAVYSFLSCVNPSGFAAPTRVSSTKTEITIQWNSPSNNGGCPITGYAIFMDDGGVHEVNLNNDPSVRNIPSL